MKNLVHNDKEVVAAPFGIGLYEVTHDAVDFLNDLHFKQLFKTDLPRCNDCSNDFESGSIELRMAHLEVLKQELYQAKLLKYQDKCLVSFDDDSQKFEAKERQWVVSGQDSSLIGQEFPQKQLIQQLSRWSILKRLIDLFFAHELSHIVRESFEGIKAHFSHFRVNLISDDWQKLLHNIIVVSVQ